MKNTWAGKFGLVSMLKVTCTHSRFNCTRRSVIRLKIACNERVHSVRRISREEEEEEERRRRRRRRINWQVEIE